MIPQKSIIAILGLCISCLLSCEDKEEKQLDPPGDYVPDKIFAFYLGGMAIEKPYIYAALKQDGLWRKNYIQESSEWEYMAFADTTLFAGATDVSVNGDHIIVTNGIKHFWHSTDGGVTWTNVKLNYYNDDRDDKLYLYLIKTSPFDPNIVLAQEGEKGIFLSVDGGYTWEFVYRNINSVEVFDVIDWHPYKNGDVWLWGRYYYSMRGMISVLGENGKSLKHESNFESEFSPKTNYIWDLVFKSTDHTIIFTIGEVNNIYKSTDSGLSWVEIKNRSTENEFYRYFLEDIRLEDSYFLFYQKNIYHTNDEFKSIRLVKSLDQSINHPMIEDNKIFYYTNEYTKEDIKFISLDSININ